MKVGNSFSGILAFSFPGAIGLLAGLLAVFPVSSYDTWWILAAGERMLETGTILTTGVGSWTRGHEPYDYHGWGFAVVAAWCHRLAGTWGLIALRSLLAAGCFFFLTLAIRVRGGSGPVLILFPTLALLFGFTNLFWPVRPQSASQMLLAALLLALSRNPHANAIQSVLVVSLLLLWSNLHGGALLGVAVVTVVAAGDFLDARRRSSFESGFDWSWRLASVLGGALTLLVTPYGYRGFLSAVRHVAGDPTATAPTEWQIPRIADYPIFLALLLLGVLGLLAALRNGRLQIRDALLLLCFALMGLSSLRYLEIAAIGLAFAGAMLWTSALRVKALSPRVNMLAVACSVLLPVALLVAGVGRDRFLFRGGWRPCRPLPVAATEYLAKYHITERLANPYEWGGYLIWALRPRDVAFIDGRVDLYTQSLLDDYRILDAGAPGWKAVTDRYQIQAIIWRAGISELREVLAKDETFVPIYLDTTAAIYVRRDGVYSHIAAATLQGGSRGRHLNR